MLKKLRTLTSSHEFTYTPEQVWSILIEPNTRLSFNKMPCYYIAQAHETIDRVGQEWKDIHTGENCKGDVVVYKVKKIIPNKLYVYKGKQNVIWQTIYFSLEATEKGCKLYDKNVLSFGMGRSLKETMESWFFLATGLLVKYAKDEEGDANYYKEFEKELKKRYGNSKLM